MLKVAVCDDERCIVCQIRDYVQSFGKLCTVDTYSSGEELIKEKREYDIIFLDIDMKGINGITTARMIRGYDKKVKLIYVTGYDDFRNYAFSVHAFGYLLKPLNEAEIHKQIKEAVEYTIQEEHVQLLRFETELGVEELDVRDIYYFEYVNRKIKIVTRGNDFIMRGSISELGKRMEAYGFYMPHKSFTINLLYVKIIKGYDVLMMNGDIIPLSQKKSVDFRGKLSNYMANQI